MAFTCRTISHTTPAERVERETVSLPGMTDVSKTLFLPLYFRAQETREHGLISDPDAVRIVGELGYDNSHFRLDREMQLIIALRTRLFDRITSRYISSTMQRGEQPVVVNLGAGLDTRELRFPKAQWYNVDLDVPIALRRRYIPTPSVSIAHGIFDDGWAEQIAPLARACIIIEGVLMYFPEDDVRRLFDTLCRNFPDSIVAFDALAPRYTALQSHQSIDVDRAPFHWGINSAGDVTAMQPRMTHVDTCSYYDEYMDNIESIYHRFRLRRFDATHRIYVFRTSKGLFP